MGNNNTKQTSNVIKHHKCIGAKFIKFVRNTHRINIYLNLQSVHLYNKWAADVTQIPSSVLMGLQKYFYKISVWYIKNDSNNAKNKIDIKKN